ncbi:RDD family protein [Mycobacterium sp. SA01]|uniref:RDD family protein n=1 Tax=Mycobacterium sp. SA01 TaxID=3238820 RepID=UPI00351B1DD1
MTTGDNDPNAYGPPGGYPPPPPTGQPGSYPPPPSGYPPPPPGQPGGYPPPPQNFYGQPSYGGGFPPPMPAGGQPGGLGIRFAARLIDGIIVGIVSFVLALLLDATSNILVTGLFSGVLTFAYFVVFEVTQGWTPAKKILGLSVHGPGGAPKPTAQQSAIRNSFTLLSVIPYIGGLLGVIAYIVIAVTINGSPTKQGKHDELAGGTQVVKG